MFSNWNGLYIVSNDLEAPLADARPYPSFFGRTLTFQKFDTAGIIDCIVEKLVSGQKKDISMSYQM